jgi:outer membrane PBP1 activator LpoA protein
MKLIIPLLVIPVLAAFVLVGCNQNSPSSSTDTQSTNSSMSSVPSAADVSTNAADASINAPATNSLPDVKTNAPASTNQ